MCRMQEYEKTIEFTNKFSAWGGQMGSHGDGLEGSGCLMLLSPGYVDELVLDELNFATAIEYKRNSWRRFAAR